MNYVVIAATAVLGYLLAAAFAFLWYAEGRDRERVEARLYTERDDVLLRCEKMQQDNEQYSEAVVELNEEIIALMERNTGLSDALEKTRVLYNNILAQNKALQAKRTPRKAVSE